MPQLDAPLALYIHWPFCVSKCPYCDFNSHVRNVIDVVDWHRALLADLAHEARLTPGRTLQSMFFGGGTPSLMPPELVASLIDAAAGHWQPADDIEITLEANPSSVEAARFSALGAAGVNRVSLGLQALHDDALTFLGRAHNVREGLDALATAQRVFNRVNIDLIYARPGQTLDDWEAELARALALGTGHLSLYQLTIEPGTRFETLVRQGKFAPADNDRAADLFALTRAMTDAGGRPAYEISNHARPGEASRHNLTYWRYGDYLGIGPGAHGRRSGTATERHKKPENYLSAMARNGHGIAREAPLARTTQASEALMMGLRLHEGLDATALAMRFGFRTDEIINLEAVERLAPLGLVAFEESHLSVTADGMLLLDAILPEIIAIAPDD